MARGTNKGNAAFRTYLKFRTTFKCTKEECQKVWTSVHGWGRDNNGVYCEFCNKRAKLLNAVDETLKLDTYRCAKEGCNNDWQAIHDEKEAEEGRQQQLCDLCETEVTPAGPPQERFGRHYWFKCSREECSEKPEWEDFSLEGQKGQRCRDCRSRGDIVMTQKLLPRYGINRRVGAGTGTGTGMSTVEARGGDASGPGPAAVVVSHNSELCDMCQDIIRQKKGVSCHKWKKVVAKLEKQEDGTLGEKIVDIE